MTTLARTRFALLATALLVLPACEDHPNPVSPLAPTTTVIAARQGDPWSGPAAGTLPDGATTYRGTVALVRFVVQDGQLLGVFSLEATLYDATGTVVGTVSEEVSLAASASATCEELDLDIAPIRFPVMGQTLEIYQGGPFLNLEIAPDSGHYTTLLCQISSQLRRGNLQAAAGLINQFLILANV